MMISTVRVPDDCQIISTCVYDGMLIVATSYYLFKLVNDELVPIPFVFHGAFQDNFGRGEE